MRRAILTLSLMFHAQTANISISSPQPGEILRGQVQIFGSMDTANFASAELAFSYASNPADSWFVIQTFLQPASSTDLAVWDTTALTDGDYILHLRVYFQDGASQDAAVSDLKIRNDVLAPTGTPTESPFAIAPISTASHSRLTEPTVTPTLAYSPQKALPPNPAALSVPLIYSTFARGALITLVLFGLFSLLLRYRKNNS